ncbi:hypothetical protein GW756_05260 [bacterium]|nr:hypothetical protein [bacterium]NCQ55363.1 hypothetical protein [Candidatus Parcubacteria bacterium]NCS96750.1 hypothetical protein [bacterium]
MKIAAIYNTAASEALKQDLRPVLDDFFKAKTVYERYDFDPENENFNDLLKSKLNVGKFDTLVLVGGDGTLRSGVNYLYHEKLVESFKVVFIPYGTGNLMRDALGLPTETDSILNAIKPEKFKVYRYGIFCDEVFMVAASIGNISALAEINDLPWFKKLFGKLSYVLKLIVSAPGFKNKSFDVSFNDTEKTIEAHSILVAPGEFIGGFMEAPKVTDKKFCVMFLSFGTDWLKLIKAIFFLLFFGKTPKPEVFETKSITIKGKNLTPLQIDGDLIDDSPSEVFNFSLGQQTLKILSFKD